MMRNNSKIMKQIKCILAGLLMFQLMILSACTAEELPMTVTGEPVLIETRQPEPQSSPTALEEPQTQISPTSEVEMGPTPTVPQKIHYQISAKLDYYNHLVLVEEVILIPQPAQEELNEILLAVPPNAWLNAFKIQDIYWQGEMPVEEYSLDGVRLTIPLDQPWLPGESREVIILYQLALPIQNAREGFGPSPFGYTALQLNLVDWYPMVPPYLDGKGWVVHDPWIFGEYLVYPAADFQVSLEIINSPDLVVAASSANLSDTEPRSYILENGRNFVFSISPDYQILEEEVNGTKVYGYIFPAYKLPGRAAFDTTVEALSLYADIYGPYNQSSLSMVQADFNHGMEYEGLYFQSRGFFDTYSGSEQSYLVTIAAHETAHQWWYGQVANDQALEPWLDEAMCTFSELVYYENLYPESVDWWWATRVNYYQPTGVIDRSIYDFQEYTDQYLAYRDATYLQGAKFLNDLRAEMGEESFIEFLREYAGTFKDQIASGEDFFNLLSSYLNLESLLWLPTYFRE
jgi:hypothetical protein